MGNEYYTEMTQWFIKKYKLLLENTEDTTSDLDTGCTP